MLSAALGGCTGSTGDDPATDVNADADIVVGPRNELTFEPTSLTAETGDEVTWYFASPKHNVSCNPAHTRKAERPAAADSFASYEGDDRYETDEEGTTFSHTFTTPGEYVYVSIPHETNGLTGNVRIRD